MFGIHDIGWFVLAVFLLNLTPGPDTAYIVGRSIAQGRIAGVLSALGIAAGCSVHALLAAFGLTALIAASPTAFAVVRVAGAIYLVGLGIRMLRMRVVDAAQAVAVHDSKAAASPRSARRLFVQGFMTNLLNPKVIVFFLSFFPQFITATSASRSAALLLLGAIFVAMSALYTCTIAWVAAALTRRLRQRSRVQTWLQRGTGTAFVLLGCKLAFQREV